MIALKLIDGATCPVFLCAFCGKPITDELRGLAVWNLYSTSTTGGVMDTGDIRFVHMGDCDRKLVDVNTGKTYRFNRGLKGFVRQLRDNLDSGVL